MDFNDVTDPKIKQHFEAIYDKGFDAGKNAACDAMLKVTKANQTAGMCPPVAHTKTVADYMQTDQGLAEDALTVILQHRSHPAEALECLLLTVTDNLVEKLGADNAMGFLYGAMMNIKKQLDEQTIKGVAA